MVPFWLEKTAFSSKIDDRLIKIQKLKFGPVRMDGAEVDDVVPV